MATVADKRPATIMALIRQRRLARDGKYEVRLFHPVHETWRTITIDDRLPVDAVGQLRNVRFTAAGEIWPALVEKALAVLFGGYQNLAGGLPYTALKSLTGARGDRMLFLTRTVPADAATGVDTASAGWVCWTPVFSEDADGVPQGRNIEECAWPDTGQRGSKARSQADVTQLLRRLHRSGSMLCCSTFGQPTDSVTASLTGMVSGHAYSLLRVETQVGREGLRLFELRNPHGAASVEWNGAWSDGDGAWEAHPEVARKLKPARVDDGTFWMGERDFATEFRSVSISLSTACARRRPKDRWMPRATPP